jgi:hypothetical protein
MLLDGWVARTTAGVSTSAAVDTAAAYLIEDFMRNSYLVELWPP